MTPYGLALWTGGGGGGGGGGGAAARENVLSMWGCFAASAHIKKQETH